MFCKHCGNQFQDDLIFCRRCGKQISESGIELPKANLLKRAAFFALGTVVFFFLLLFSYSIANPLVLLTSSIVFAGIIAVLLSEIKELKKTSSNHSNQKQIKNSKDLPKLPEKLPVESFWNITDNTTRDLTADKKRITDGL